MSESRTQAFGELAAELLRNRLAFRFQARGRSMFPVIQDGEILHVQPASSRLKVGDIVLFREGATFKAHRIIRKQKDHFITRGDAGIKADAAIQKGQIVGKITAKECAQSGAIVRLDGRRARMKFFAAEARRQARKYLSRPRGVAGAALLLCFLSLAVPFAHSQVALDVVAPFTLTSVANAAGGTTVYTGTITGGAANAYVGVVFTIAGFTTAADNGTFTCTASTATTLTLNNAAGVAQTHAATATSLATSSLAQSVTQAANTVTVAHNTITASNLLMVVGISTNISAQSTLTLTGAIAAGANTVYTGTINGGGSNAYVGFTFTVAGFTGGGTPDNGTFICTASTPTTLTLANAVGVTRAHAATATAATFQSVTGVTYNGVALTSAGSHNDPTNVRRVELWYLIAPATGNNNVVVTENLVAGGSVPTVVGATTFSGADQTSPIRTFASNDGNSDSANVTVTSSANDMVIDTVAVDGTHTVASGTGTQVQQWALATGATAADVYGFGSTHGGAASVPMSEVLNSATIWSDAAVSIQPLQTDLSVSVSGTSALFPANLVYTVTVTNNGPTAIPSSGSVPGTTVTLTDTLAAGLTLVSATPTQGSCSGTTTITCNLVTNAAGIGIGSSVTITITVTPGAPGGYPNTASVTSSMPDLVNANNSATGVAYSSFAACATTAPAPGGVLTGTINTYYPGTATANAGSTSITLGAATGAATAIASGDLVLIIQMQDAAINFTNTSAYGDGLSGSGSTSLNNAGAYEYATATSAVPAGGGTLTVTAAGPGGGLLFTYTSAAASAAQGARTFQVVRVPNYTTATLGAALTASAWNGSTGGILALNLSGLLTLNGATVHADGLGFRGGAGLDLVGSLVNLTQVANHVGATTVYTGTITGGAANALAGTTFIVAGFTNALNNGTFVATASTATTLTLANANGVAVTQAGTASISPGATNGDFLFPSPNSYVTPGPNARIGADGSKAEGIAGTPHWLISAGAPASSAQTYAEGYPIGSMGRGAPGNAGGGGTDGDPVNTAAPGGNDQNAGGGGGANGGTGGQGGDTWNSNLTTGGFGGAAFPADINRVVLGGGGGSGSSNNNNNVLSSSGAAGGGIIMIRAGSLTGTATITANGAAAYNNTPNDAAGGGGGGGSIIVLTGNGGEGGLTLQAQGGRGGDAWDTQPYSNANRHGPGGGGGGGVVLTSSVTGTPTISVTGGASGVTLTGPSVSYGATPGTAGVSATNLTLSSSPGQHSAAICTDMAITKTGAPQPVLQNATLTYTVKVTNNGPQTATGVVITDTLPSQVTYVSAIATGTGSCSQSGGVVTCNYATMVNGDIETIIIKVTATTPSLALNTAIVNSATPDPVLSNNTATFTSTIEFPNAVRINSFDAGKNGSVVLVTWKSGGEFHNLGFNVYREVAGAKVQINPSLIAGSALLMNEVQQRHGAKSYAWIDRAPASGAQYWLEDVDLNGARTMHGPIAVSAGPPSPQAIARVSSGNSAALTVASTVALGSGTRIRETVAAPRPNATTLNTGFQFAAGPAVKIYVDHEGWYHITQPQLVAAGLDPTANANTLHLYAEGVEQPIQITGASTSFGPQAAIEFYGTAIDTPYSGQRAYWLVSGGGPGLRISAAPPAGSSGPQPQSFIQTVELRDRTTYFAALLRDNTDNFFGPLISPTPETQTLNLVNLAPGQSSITVALQGVTQSQQHDVTVTLNGTTLGNVTFTGQQEGRAAFVIPAGTLVSGLNTITMTSQLGASDLSLVDYIDVSVPHAFTAASDVLKFTAAAGNTVAIGGFLNPPTRLVDITNPLQPLTVTFTTSTQSSGYALQATVPWTSSGTHSLLALADDALAAPVAFAPHAPSNLHSPQPGAQVVMLTAPQFKPQLAPLAALRQAQGRSVAIVSVDDVYDEFNFGERSPYAIRTFLQTATTAWKTSPHFLLLAGDASVDPRNYLGFGFFDFVPTKIVITAELKTASDDWFSDFNNTGFATMATGRLPARTTADAQSLVSKILAYSNAPPASWTNDTMLVADINDPGTNFTQAAQAVQKFLPQTMNVSDVFASTLGPATAHQQLIAGINSGQLLVNYNGHGSVEIWGSGLFDDTAAAALVNGNKLPLVVAMNCLNGFFHDVYTQSLAEALMLAPNGGAVSVWASSGLTAPGPQFQMDQTLVKTLFSQPSTTLGDAVLLAKQNIADPDVRKTFILFGDPLLRLKLPNAAIAVGNSRSNLRMKSPGGK